MGNSTHHQGPRFGVFHLSCWILALVAFMQVMGVGVAIVIRPESTVVKEVVTEYVTISRPVVATPPPSARPPAAVPVAEPEPEPIQMPDFRPEPEIAEQIAREALRSAPAINEPVAERLVHEARESRIRSDHMKAIIKLEEAIRLEPDHPAIIYEMATNFEVMGIYDKATDQYLKLNALGPLKGGALWKKASLKLEKGIVPEAKEFTSLGVVRPSTVEETRLGERRGVILPISVSANEAFDPSLLETKVHFFEKQQDKVKQVISPENQGFAWLSEPVDWSDGEELVEVWYHIPRADRSQQHLFGDRSFYGFVAELYYAGELVDVNARPRLLINKIRGGERSYSQQDWDPDIDPILESLQEYETGDPLLPELPQKR